MRNVNGQSRSLSAQALAAPRRLIDVLLIEDNPGDARLVQELLREAHGLSFRVVHEQTLQAGLDYLAASTNVGAILLDAALPDSSGLDTLWRTLTAAPETAVIVLTGRDDDSLAMIAMQWGAQDYLSKRELAPQVLARAIQYAIHRKGLESSLRRTEAFNLSILNALEHQVAVLDASGRIVAVNESWSQFAVINGASDPARLGVGANYFAVCEAAKGETATEAPAALAGMKRVLAGDLERFELEYPCHAPGAERWFLMRVTPFSLEPQAGLVVAHLDITARKKNEDALAKSLERYELLTSATKDVIFEWDVPEDRLVLSQAITERFGHVLDGHVPIRWWSEHIHPLDRAQVASFLEAVEGDETLWTGEYRFRRADGSYADVLDRSLIVRNILGQAERVMGSIIDLSRQKEAERALAVSEARLTALIESANDFVWSVDRDYRMLAANAAYRAFFKEAYGAELELGMRVTDYAPPGRQEAWITNYERALRGESFRQKHARELNGRTLIFDISFNPILSGAGEVEGVTVFIRDISELEGAHAALQEANAKAIKDYERLLHRITEVAQAFNHAQNPEDVFRALWGFVRATAPLSSGMFIALYDHESRERRCVYAVSEAGEEDVTALPPRPLNGNGQSRAILSRQVVLDRDHLAADPANADPANASDDIVLGGEVDARPSVASISAPMLALGRVVGVFEAQSVNTAAFGEEHITALAMVGNLAAIAIENVQALERERASQRALESSERRFKSLVQNGADIITLASPEGVILYESPSASAVLGHAPGTRVGKQALELIHPDDLPLVKAAREAVLTKGKTRVTYRLRHADGTWRWLEATAHNALGDPDVGAVVINSRDITERLKTQEHVVFQASLLEQVHNAVIATDLGGSILYWSRFAETLYGWRAEEVMGKNVYSVLPMQGINKSGPDIKRAVLETGSWQGEFQIERKDGSHFPAQVTFSSFKNARGELEGFIGVSVDLSERKRAENELKEINTVLQSALEGISHLSASGHYLSVNQAYAALTGYSQEELLTMTWQSLVHRDDHALVQAAYERMTAEGRAETDVRGLHKSGSVFYARVVLIKSLDPQVEVHCFTQDITEHTLALQALEAQAQTVQALNQELKTRLSRLDALHTVDMAITSSMSLNLTLEVLLDELVGQLEVDAAAVLLYNPGSFMLEYARGRGINMRSVSYPRLRLGQGQAGRAALERQVVRIDDIASHMNAFVGGQQLIDEGFSSYLAVPLQARGELKGVLEVFCRGTLPHDEGWTGFLQSLSLQAALAVDSTSMFEELQRSNVQLTLAYDASIEAWSRALDLRDKETEGHSQRVTELTMQLAQLMGVAEGELVHVRRGALLHDIGKMGVPDSILLKPGKLSDDEWLVMKKHPKFAHDLLSPIRFLRPALAIPYCHHERWDGLGYPRGLKGEEIPLAARIFAVVDVYDALTSDRPYRAAWPSDRALDYIKEHSGSHFDPRVVEVFMSLVGSPLAMA